jgi:hypothetical protein
MAEGTEAAPITFRPAAGATPWNRLRFVGGAQASRIAYATVAGASGRGNVTADDTELHLDHVVFTNTVTQLVTVDNTSIDLRHCVFPTISNDELVHFARMPPNGYSRIIGNHFGGTTGYNDILDLTSGNRPGPIHELVDNVFESAVDDCFDMDGADAHIEGNIFFNVRQDSARESSSNPISTGADGGNTSELVIARNFFVNCEHSLLLKDAGSALMQNNTVLSILPNPVGSQPPGIINFCEANRGVPGGRGALFEGNIVWDLQAEPWVNFSNELMFLEVSHSLIQGMRWPGPGNLAEDPAFVDPAGLSWQNVRQRLALQSASPARGTGPNGLDMGAVVPAGASVSGEPGAATTNTSAALTVAGPGIYAYKWRLNDGPWSGEVALTNSLLIAPTLFTDAQPILLTNLTPGMYQVSVIGKNSAGTWQDEAEATRSRSWGVLPADGAGGVQVGGVLREDTAWTSELGEIWVVSPLEILAGVTLSIEAGAQLRFAAGAGITVTNGTIIARGNSVARVRFAAWDGASLWGPVRVAGDAGRVMFDHVDLAQGSLEVVDGAWAELVNCRFRDFVSGTKAILRALRPGRFVMRRCAVSDYYEVISQLAVSEIEDCLFENPVGDGLDLDGGQPGSFVRGCTFRHGTAANVDAVDVGSYVDGTASEGVVIERCLIWDFPFDKGVSIGERSRDVIVRNCLMRGVDAGVAVKDGATAALSNITVVDSNHGFRLYEKVAGQGGGHAESWNNILWDNGSAITLDSLSSITVAWSDVAGGSVGERNLNVDPGFRDPALGDYRLRADSAVRGQGRDGLDMGVILPLGSSLVDTDGDQLPDPWEWLHDLNPNHGEDAVLDLDGDGLDNRAEYMAGTDPGNGASRLALTVDRVSGLQIDLHFDGVVGRSYRVEYSDNLDSGGWMTLEEVSGLEQDAHLSVRDAFRVDSGPRWYRLRLTSHP